MFVFKPDVKPKKRQSMNQIPNLEYTLDNYRNIKKKKTI